MASPLLLCTCCFVQVLENVSLRRGADTHTAECVIHERLFLRPNILERLVITHVPGWVLPPSSSPPPPRLEPPEFCMREGNPKVS